MFHYSDPLINSILHNILLRYGWFDLFRAFDVIYVLVLQPKIVSVFFVAGGGKSVHIDTSISVRRCMLHMFQYSDPLYLKSVQSAVETGVPCLLENVGENLDPGKLSVCRHFHSLTKRSLVQ